MLCSRDLVLGHCAPPGSGKAPLVLPVRAAWTRARSSVGTVRQRICRHEKHGRCGGSQTRPPRTLALQEP